MWIISKIMYLEHVVDNMKNVFLACVAGGFFGVYFFSFAVRKVRVLAA